MKFFILDNQNSISNQIELLKNLFIKIDIVNGMLFDNPIKEYQKDRYDFLIVDSTHKNSLEVFTKIIQINPNQKTINYIERVTSEKLKTCKYCKTTHNIRCLLKPFDLLELYNIIKVKDNTCKFSTIYEKNEIKENLEHIYYKNRYYEFDTKEKIFKVKSGHSSSLVIREHISITDFLSEHNIDFDNELFPHIKIY